MKPFLDSNILIYAYGSDARGERARNLLAEGGTIAVQSLNEFTDVARRKFGFTWAQVDEAIAELLELCTMHERLTAETHAQGRAIAQRHKLRIFDAMLLATALDAECEVFLTEDLHDGLVVQGQITIRNAFV